MILSPARVPLLTMQAGVSGSLPALMSRWQMELASSVPIRTTTVPPNFAALDQSVDEPTAG